MNCKTNFFKYSLVLGTFFLGTHSLQGQIVKPAAPFRPAAFGAYDQQSVDQDDDLADESDRDEEDLIDLLDDDDTEQQRHVRPPFGPWPKKSIHETRIDIRETNPVAPEDRSASLIYGAHGSNWNDFQAAPKVLAWAAPNIRYQPLYFEDVPLERYGQTRGLLKQPYVSGYHFFKSFALLPYQMYHDAPQSCDYPLGFCRPGSSAPCTDQASLFGF